jgi:CBS domain-containing protein
LAVVPAKIAYRLTYKAILQERITLWIMSIYLSPISDFMTRKVITTTIEQTIQSVCKSMYENNVGCLIVVKRELNGLVPVGIITERDIVKIIGSSEVFIGQAPIREFMTYPLITGSPNTTISQAIEIMDTNKIRRLPVIESDKEGEKLVGIISVKDILRVIEKSKRD